MSNSGLAPPPAVDTSSGCSIDVRLARRQCPCTRMRRSRVGPLVEHEVVGEGVDAVELHVGAGGGDDVASSWPGPASATGASTSWKFSALVVGDDEEAVARGARAVLDVLPAGLDHAERRRRGRRRRGPRRSVGHLAAQVDSTSHSSLLVRPTPTKNALVVLLVHEHVVGRGVPEPVAPQLVRPHGVVEHGVEDGARCRRPTPRRSTCRGSRRPGRRRCRGRGSAACRPRRRRSRSSRPAAGGRG